VKRAQATIATLLAAASILVAAPAAHAEIPDWVRPAIRYLDDKGWLDRDNFRPNQPMSRRMFRRIVNRAFAAGYERTEGDVTAAEASRLLVRELGRAGVASTLNKSRSPDGWDPNVSRYFGTEIVARELGLRHDRPTTEESKEASATESMRQADVVWAVWRAKTAPATYSADALGDFALANYSEKRRGVVRFALSLVGTPYVWGGEWPKATPSNYPYGAQAHGGFDCSGFAWYVLRRSASGWNPMNRPYEGWSLPERASYDMARATRNRLAYRELKPGDLLFFAPDGRDARARDVYHAGIYLGRGWMVHSSGSRAGISLGEVGRGAWWHDQFAWGRRVIR